MNEIDTEYHGRRVGYLRCSRNDQNEDRQIDGLLPHCDEMHVEFVSAASRSRPVFDRIVTGLRAGDTLVVWDIDRAFRSSFDALDVERSLRARGVTFQIVKVAMDTATAEGEFVFTMLSALAQFERRLLSRRTKEGLAAARRRGVRLGRPPKMTSAQICEARRRIIDNREPLSKVAADYGVTPWTLSRSLKRTPRHGETGLNTTRVL